MTNEQRAQGWLKSWRVHYGPEAAQSLTALLDAVERDQLEAACDVARARGYATGHADNAADLLRHVIDQAVERGDWKRSGIERLQAVETDPTAYIRENLLHEPDCNDGFPDMTKADGCTCRRAEVIAWLENKKWDAEHDSRSRGYRAGRESMRREAAGVCREMANVAQVQADAGSDPDNFMMTAEDAECYEARALDLEQCADAIEALDQES